MTDPKNEVLFCEYCKTCKHKLCDCEDEPCCDCLATPVNYYSHKPVLWEGVDTLFNKPVARVDHAANREVRELTRAIDGIIQGDLSGDYVNETSTSIRDHMFADNIGLANVTFTKATYVGERAFGLCPNLKTLNFPEVLKMDYPIVDNSCTNLTTLYFDKLSNILCKDAFAKLPALQEIHIPQLEGILPNRTFEECPKLILVEIPKIEQIGEEAFRNCDSLADIDFPKVSVVEAEAFYGCGALTNIDFPKVSTIGNRAFTYCSNLESAILPEATRIEHEVFSQCSSLTNLYAPKLEYIGEKGLANTGLSSIATDNRLTLLDYAFYACHQLKEVHLSNTIDISNSCFGQCDNLESVNIPKVLSIGDYAFSGCEKLTSFDLGNVTFISNGAFQDCCNLSTVYARKVTKIGRDAFSTDTTRNSKHKSHIHARMDIYFTDVTKIPTISLDSTYGGVFPTASIVDIHVPANLYSSWIRDADWKTELSRAGYYGNVKIKYIGTAYRIRTSCNDGGTVDSDDWVVASGSSHTVIIQPDSGVSVSSVTVDGSDVTSQLVTFERSKTPTVTKLTNASYGFELNANGYYESTNKKKSNSAAVCKVDFNFEQETQVTFDVINSGEVRYDYGIFSKVDTPLSLTSTPTDPDILCHWTGKTFNTNTTSLTISYIIPAGEHFIYIKYRKDGSGDSGSDSLQFKLANPELFGGSGFAYTLENIQADHDIVVTFGDAETETT